MLGGRCFAFMQVSCARCMCLARKRELDFQAVKFHTSYGDANRPPRSGDHGPQKNFQKKVRKSERKQAVKSQQSPQEKTFDSAALLKGMKALEGRTKLVSAEEHSDTLRGLLKDIKVFTPASDDVRKRLGMPDKTVRERAAPKVKGRGSRQWMNFMDPFAGKRLGIFEPPSATSKVMPPHKATFEEEDNAKGIESLLKLKYKNQFELVMEETQFPRHYPIDNMDYESEEHEVGFEDHVLIDHYLDGFPKKGPVRHFMELVVSGLSRSPHYTAREKREYIEWYRDYFCRYSPEEMQTVLPSKTE